MERIALISTPRSGNTWVRYVLAETLGLEQIAVHNPRDIPSTLPTRVILQIHWYREPNFQEFLRDNHFRVISLARHPLDVLVSILHFVRRALQSDRWLGGNGELPAELASATPCSDCFAAYAKSWGAENLLSVSHQWSHHAGAVTVRYEDLVRSPRDGFTRLLGELGSGSENLQKALEVDWLQAFKSTPNSHGWQGTPGLWRKLIVPRLAYSIRNRHLEVFKTLNYSIPPTFLTRRAAASNWLKLTEHPFSAALLTE